MGDIVVRACLKRDLLGGFVLLVRLPTGIDYLPRVLGYVSGQ